MHDTKFLLQLNPGAQGDIRCIICAPVTSQCSTYSPLWLSQEWLIDPRTYRLSSFLMP
jgi:LSD1 subclass zinc finger protein